MPTDATLTREELDRLNRKGDRGETLSYVGAGVAVAGLGVAGVALYKGFVARSDERGIAIVPTVSKDGAGATMSLRW